MGFDVSYHPIKEEEIQKWYFEPLRDKEKIGILAKEYKIEEFYKEKYVETIKAGEKVKNNELFDVTHGYYIAVVQGFFRKYFYTRGSAFSFLIEQNNKYKEYTKNWGEIILQEIKNPANNLITENYCSGVFIPPENIVKLLNDYRNVEKIKMELEGYYSHNITEFIKALNMAKENGLGLLEATEVIEPNPLDLNSSKCYSNLFNCDPGGAILYSEFAMGQIREIEKQNNFQEGEITKKGEYIKTKVGEAEENVKKGLWKKLFGK